MLYVYLIAFAFLGFVWLGAIDKSMDRYNEAKHEVDHANVQAMDPWLLSHLQHRKQFWFVTSRSMCAGFISLAAVALWLLAAHPWWVH